MTYRKTTNILQLAPTLLDHKINRPSKIFATQYIFASCRMSESSSEMKLTVH